MRLWNYFAGYVMIRVEGLSLEKLLNTAADLRVTVFDVRRVSYTVLRAVVSARGYRKLTAAMPGRFDITAEKKAGVPFGFRWLVARKVMLAGLVLLAVAAFTASLFVLEVRISGLDDNEAESLKGELAALGITPGAYKAGLDLKQAETRLLIAHEEFAWINIRIRGVVADIHVVLAEPVPEIFDDSRPSHIVAIKDALIERITARTGRALVGKGDTVRTGDVLISGLVWDAGLSRMLFAARGEVVGSVWYAAKAIAPVSRQARVPTGRTQLQRVIAIGADTADVDAPCAFETYDTRVADVRYVVGLYLPVKILVLEHSEIKLVSEPVDLQILRVDLEERAYYDAAALAEADIVSHVAVFEERDGMLAVTVYVQTHEDIGKVVYLEDQ